MYGYLWTALFIHRLHTQFGHFLWVISISMKVFFPSQPYLHESRHRHAMKRVRGPGGRFLNKKELQEQQLKALPSLQTPTGGVSKMAFGRNLCPESSTSHSPSTSSTISSATNWSGTLAHQEHVSFASANKFLPSMNFHAENGGEKMAINGVRHHTPVLRWTASTVGVLCWYHHWRAPVCPWQFILGLWCIL